MGPDTEGDTHHQLERDGSCFVRSVGILVPSLGSVLAVFVYGVHAPIRHAVGV